jgi:hypothetical protein
LYFSDCYNEDFFLAYQFSEFYTTYFPECGLYTYDSSPQHCEVHFCGLYNYSTSGKIIAADLELWSHVQVETNVNTSIQKP